LHPSEQQQSIAFNWLTICLIIRAVVERVVIGEFIAEEDAVGVGQVGHGFDPLDI